MVIYIFVGILALFVVLYLLVKILRKPQETPPRRIDTGTPETSPPPSKPASAPSPESASPAAPTPSATAEASTVPPATPPAEPAAPTVPAAVMPAVVAAAVRVQAAPAPFGAHVPQDSVLRRHYIAQAQLMAETIAGPRPADSVLRRHHRQLILSRLAACLRDSTQMEQLRADYAACRAAQPAKSAPQAEIPPAAPVEVAVEAPNVLTAAKPEAAPAVAAPKRTVPMGAHVPQDSVLRRHYLAQAQLMAETVAGPRPADSVLRRHHQQLVQSRLEACLGDAPRMDQLRADYAACRAVPAPTPVAAVAIAPQAAIAAPAPVAEAPQRTVRIPEDSILRRHFLSHVRHLLEKTAPVRPTDSVLRRHYEHHIGRELRACLGDPARIERLFASRAARQA